MADHTKDDPGIWRQMSAGLYMQADVTDAGRLVRLADVVRWVVRKKEKDVNGRPLAEAVDWVCDKLKAAPRETEFFDAHPVTWANPVQAADSLGYFTKERLAEAVRAVEALAQDGADGDRVVDLLPYAPSDVIAQANAAAGGVSRANAAEVLSLLAHAEIVQPGPEAVAHCMRRNWTHAGWQAFFLGGEVKNESDLDDRNRRPWSLCVRVQDAQAIWDWGMALTVEAVSPFPLADWAALVKHRKKHPGTSWATGQDGDNQIELAQNEFKRHGGPKENQKSKVLAAMAEELGTHRQALDRALFGERKRMTKRQAPSPLHSAKPAGRKSA